MTRTRLLLDDPHAFLHWLQQSRKQGFSSLQEVDVAHVFAVASIAAMARQESPEFVPYAGPAAGAQLSGAARFAHAIGIEAILEGHEASDPVESQRTVKLTNVRGPNPEAAAERIAGRIVDLLLPQRPRTDAADLFWFVLVELLRNVGQHSKDPAGGIVAAQVNDGGPYAGAPALQVVVADNGIGVFEALRRMRPTIQTPTDALVRALEPHVSGTFAEGQSGSVHNAGLGLFFISEIAKKTKGRLLMASRGASYFLDRSRDPNSQPRLTNGVDPDYPGTLVVFETALGEARNYEEIMRGIRELAAARTPKRITQQWLHFGEPPPGTFRSLVAIASEDTTAARAFAVSVLEPRLLRREPVALDFATMRVCTQSFLHALLHEVVRLAWARKVPIHVVNATPAVRAQLELVESYSLGG